MTEPGVKVCVRLRASSGAWFVHPDLRDKVARSADEGGTSISDVATTILAEAVGVPYTPRRRPGRPFGTRADNLILHVQPDVLRAVNVAAARADRKPMDLIRETLSAHYGFAMPDTIAA